MSVFKPTPAHRNAAPAVCLCADCSRIMLAKRCQARDADGNQCGDYKHRGTEHTLLVATVFQIAAERSGSFLGEPPAGPATPL